MAQANDLTIYREKVATLLAGLNGKMFSVDFLTKDGSLRTLNGRLNVKAHCGNGKGPGDRMDLPYITVWEAPKPQNGPEDGRKKYRCVNLSTIQAVRANGRKYNLI